MTQPLDGGVSPDGETPVVVKAARALLADSEPRMVRFPAPRHDSRLIPVSANDTVNRIP